MYYNSEVIEDTESVIGTVKDLKEFFRYKIVSLCIAKEAEEDIEKLCYDVERTIELLKELNDVDDENIKVIVRENVYGGFYYERYDGEE